MSISSLPQRAAVPALLALLQVTVLWSAPPAWYVEQGNAVALSTPEGATAVFWATDPDSQEWVRLEVSGQTVRSVARYAARDLETGNTPVSRGSSPVTTQEAMATYEEVPRFYSSTTGLAYHLQEDCPCGRRIPPHRRLYFSTVEAARCLGRHVCVQCEKRLGKAYPRDP